MPGVNSASKRPMPRACTFPVASTATISAVGMPVSVINFRLGLKDSDTDNLLGGVTFKKHGGLGPFHRDLIQTIRSHRKVPRIAINLVVLERRFGISAKIDFGDETSVLGIERNTRFKLFRRRSFCEYYLGYCWIARVIDSGALLVIKAGNSDVQVLLKN